MNRLMALRKTSKNSWKKKGPIFPASSNRRVVRSLLVGLVAGSMSMSAFHKYCPTPFLQLLSCLV